MNVGFSSIRISLVIGALALGCARETEPSAPPQPPPDRGALTVLQGSDTTDVHLDDYRGTVLLLDFWAPWSLPCRDAAPQLERMHTDLSGQSFSVIGMTLVEEATPAVMEDLDSLAVSYPVVLANAKARKKYGPIRAIPTKVLVGRDGAPLRTYPGWVSPEALREDVEKVLRGESLPPLPQGG